jgi:hypothetical protein
MNFLFTGHILGELCDEVRTRERVECGSDQCIRYDQCSMTSRQRVRGQGGGPLLYMEPTGAVLPDGIITSFI